MIPSIPSESKLPNEVVGKDWNNMSYEDREIMIQSFINDKSFKKADFELRIQLKESILKQIKNPSTLSFTLEPSIYNGFANIVEADSGWIYVPYRAKAKNDFGIEKEIAGSVMFKYNGLTNTLGIRDFDISQNN